MNHLKLAGAHIGSNFVSPTMTVTVLDDEPDNLILDCVAENTLSDFAG